jgi:hypothetical protein
MLVIEGLELGNLEFYKSESEFLEYKELELAFQPSESKTMLWRPARAPDRRVPEKSTRIQKETPMRRSGVAVAGLILALAGAGRAQAQIAWESPMLIGPGAPGGLGLFLMEPWPGDDFAVMGTYRTSPVPVGLGFRLGLGEGWRDELAVFGGVDVAGSLLSATDDLPLDVVWFAGAGIGIGEDALLSFPVGLSVGVVFESEGVRFAPYVAPRVVLDACLGDEDERVPFCGRGDNLELDLAADVGLDLSFSPDWMIRFAASLGDRESLAIGIVLPY